VAHVDDEDPSDRIEVSDDGTRVDIVFRHGSYAVIWMAVIPTITILAVSQHPRLAGDWVSDAALVLGIFMALATLVAVFDRTHVVLTPERLLLRHTVWRYRRSVEWPNFAELYTWEMTLRRRTWYMVWLATTAGRQVAVGTFRHEDDAVYVSGLIIDYRRTRSSTADTKTKPPTPV
jgi:hypothetical protein